MRVRSLVGLLPMRERHPERLGALLTTGEGDRSVTSVGVVPPDRLARLLRHMLDEEQFLSPHGIRSLSAVYRHGFSVPIDGAELPIAYAPAESDSALFGGNSNWSGPVWFPLNVLLADALRTYAVALVPSVTVELPTGSGHEARLDQVADAIDKQLVALFRPGPDGRRPSDPVHVGSGPLWSPHPTFSEYFHGDTGAGLGASHQTGWTALVAHLICQPRADPMPGA